MTVTTLAARVLLALDLVQKYSSVYFGVGQADSWNSSDTPTAEDTNATAIANPEAYVQVKTASLCRLLEPDEATPDDTISFNDKTYVRVANADAYKQKATCVYFETKINLSDVTVSDTFTFRSSGVYVGVKPKSGVTKPVLTPTDVSSTGTLFSLSNGNARILDDETSIKLGVIYTMAPFDA